MNDGRIINAGLAWVREEEARVETWQLDVEGLHVWVKDYGDTESDIFSGWRVGVGASPRRIKYDSQEDALNGAIEAAREEARARVAEAKRKLAEANVAAGRVGA